MFIILIVVHQSLHAVRIQIYIEIPELLFAVAVEVIMPVRETVLNMLNAEPKLINAVY